MEQKEIKLRGHHIEIFAIPYLKNLVITQQKRSFFKKEDKFHNLENKRIYLGVGYGEKMENSVNEIYQLLQTEPNLKVKITGGLDSICMVGCPWFRPLCKELNYHNIDVSSAKEYDLEIGKIYTAKEIIQKIKDYGINKKSSKN